jgi:hypothetical protein
LSFDLQDHNSLPFRRERTVANHHLIGLDHVLQGEGCSGPGCRVHPSRSRLTLCMVWKFEPKGKRGRAFSEGLCLNYFSTHNFKMLLTPMHTFFYKYKIFSTPFNFMTLTFSEQQSSLKI